MFQFTLKHVFSTSPFLLNSTRGLSMATTTTSNLRKRIISGIQPTGGVPHLGNYLGAIKNWVILQNENTTPTTTTTTTTAAAASNTNTNTNTTGSDVMYMIVDSHAITVPISPKELRQNIINMTISLLACGIDPAKSIVFQQSQVSGHAELMWILGCQTPSSWLSRMTQWKAKKEQLQQTAADWGLFSYPVLMAADVLLYKATHVPVGDDQQQHLELTNHIAKAFNFNYQTNFFPLTEPIYNDGARIMSLRAPTAKMSKSDTSDKSRINLTDSDADIKQKIQKALTDSFDSKIITFEPDTRAGIANLLRIIATLENKSIEQVAQDCQKENYHVTHLKEKTVELLIKEISPIRERINQLSSNPSYIQTVLNEGSAKANVIAKETMQQVRKIIGFD